MIAFLQIRYGFVVSGTNKCIIANRWVAISDECVLDCAVLDNAWEETAVTEKWGDWVIGSLGVHGPMNQSPNEPFY